MIAAYSVEIPEELTLNFLYSYPDPPFKTFTDLKVFFGSVLNLWIPPKVVKVEKPTVLIPEK